MQFQINKAELNTYIKQLKKNFLVFYPIKANSNKKLVSYLNGLVDGYETDSLYHIVMLTKCFHVSPDKILYSYPLKNQRDITVALKHGITNFVVDNIKECEKIIRLSKKSVNFIIRLDVGEIINCNSAFVKWGANLQDIVVLQRLIEKSSHKLRGFSFYLPQEINNANNFRVLFDKLFRELNVTNYEMLDIGGGISDEMLPNIVGILGNYVLGTSFQIIIEQGKHLLNRAIDLKVEVLDLRYKNGKKLVFIDSGIYHGLLDVILKNVRYEIFSCKKTRVESCIVCGDSSDVSDVIGEYQLPADLKRGDELIIKGCGAYCEEFITPFCKKKKPTIKLT